jgi:4-diphosphocytidyl-2-C-methyl-D-erythritol kinase
MMTPSLSPSAIHGVAAPAKVNLFLHVVGQRSDGYHLLQSVFALIDWADTLHFERRADGQLRRHDLGAALPPDDLRLRAASALQRAAQTPWGADISIDKQVPWGAGLGGGSSDAASCLLALNRLWQLHWPIARLQALGLSLGADVPFFLGGHNAWAEGIGEQLTPITLPALWLPILKPAQSIATPTIFSSPLLNRQNDAVIVAHFFAQAGIQRLLDGYGSNSLQPPAEHLCPEVAQAAQLLRAQFGNSRMTGSGSAVFARAGTLADTPAPPAMVGASQLPPGWVGRMCRSLPHHPLLEWCSN